MYIFLFMLLVEDTKYVHNGICHEIQWVGKEDSRLYVVAVLANEKKTKMPIINGYIPAIYEDYKNGVLTKRRFDYKEQYKYDGRREVTYKMSKRQLPRIGEEVTDRFGRVISRNDSFTIINVPVLDGMKKPSEVDKGKLSPKYK